MRPKDSASSIRTAISGMPKSALLNPAENRSRSVGHHKGARNEGETPKLAADRKIIRRLRPTTLVKCQTHVATAAPSVGQEKSPGILFVVSHARPISGKYQHLPTPPIAAPRGAWRFGRLPREYRRISRFNAIRLCRSGARPRDAPDPGILRVPNPRRHVPRKWVSFGD